MSCVECNSCLTASGRLWLQTQPTPPRQHFQEKNLKMQPGDGASSSKRLCRHPPPRTPALLRAQVPRSLLTPAAASRPPCGHGCPLPPGPTGRLHAPEGGSSAGRAAAMVPSQPRRAPSQPRPPAPAPLALPTAPTARPALRHLSGLRRLPLTCAAACGPGSERRGTASAPAPSGRHFVSSLGSDVGGRPAGRSPRRGTPLGAGPPPARRPPAPRSRLHPQCCPESASARPTCRSRAPHRRAPHRRLQPPPSSQTMSCGEEQVLFPSFWVVFFFWSVVLLFVVTQLCKGGGFLASD